MTGSSIGPGTNADYATIKYDPHGNQLWVARYNGPRNGSDYANAVAIDSFGNIYVTGSSIGPGTYTDYATIKYGPNGNQLWVARYKGTDDGFDCANAIAVDDSGNVYVTGYRTGLDTHRRYTKIKYDRDGRELWVAKYSEIDYGSDYTNTVAVDNFGNMYVTGSSAGSGISQGYCTIKYDPNGKQLWTAKHDGTYDGFDYANAIAVDKA